MKLIRSIFFLVFLFLGASAHAQTHHHTQDSAVTLTVAGVCGMCEQRIEKSLKVKGVSYAQWDAETQKLSLRFNPAQVSLDQIHTRLAEVGHDTEEKKASDEVYNALPECCRYRELTPHADDHANHEAMLFDSLQTASHRPLIRGVVLEEDNKGNFRPLRGASVLWLGTSKGTTTDEHGVFGIVPQEGNQQLVVSYAGFQPDTLTVTDQNELTIVLASNNQLKGVTVVSRRAATYINAYNPFRTAIMTQKELFKAACCNLSESFETNPSVDVSYNDAVTGSKQIQLLGLSGNYTQLTVENLPGPRGIATAQGLNSIAGPWVESIQLTKGIGSVVNGYESIAGQINVELKKPVNSEKLYLNGYINNFKKNDLNLNWSQKLGEKWATAVLLHNAYLNNKVDENGDGFRDLPTGNLFSGINRWHYTGTNGWSSQFGFKILLDDKTGGELDFDPEQDKFSTHYYGLGINTKRYEGFGKIGYTFPAKKYKSIGLQVSAFDHQQNAYFGLTTYDAEQKNFYSNLIYQSIIGNDAHKFKTGFSFLYDRYNEDLNALNFRRTEVVPGAFFEYTYSLDEKLNVVAGIRADHNSLFGFFATPRLNVRYQPVNGTTIRASIGRGQRTANIFAENNSVLVSARQVQILPSGSGKAYGLNPEVAWNKGISVDQKWKLFQKDASLSVEYYRNDFTDQVVVDLEDVRQVRFYNLKGKSYSNSFQAELHATPVDKLDVRLAYRFFDVKTTYGDQLLQKPFTARHRAFANLAYELGQWKFDYTVNLIGEKRIPDTEANPQQYRLPQQSPAYVLMNAQVSKAFGKDKRFEAYIGGENLTNYLQKNAVIAAAGPFSPYFDASMIWGPVSGRMLYAGFRYSIK